MIQLRMFALSIATLMATASPCLAERKVLASDFRWAEGFQNNTASWIETVDQAKQTAKENTERLNRELAKQIPASLAQPDGCWADLQCEAILSLEELRPLFAKQPQLYEDALKQAQKEIQRLDSILGASEQFATDPNASLGDKIVATVLHQQEWRGAIAVWSAPDDKTPPETKSLVLLGIRLRTIAADLAAVKLLRDHDLSLTNEAYRSLSGLQKRAVWQIAQHADREPLLQSKLLNDAATVRLDSDEQKNFAYLTDRVGLALRGTQTFGTQLICKGTRWTLAPIDDEAGLAARRSKIGLSSVEDYLKLAGGVCSND